MTMKKKNFLKIIFLAVLIVGTVLIIMQQRNTPYQHDTGFVFGTEYHITYPTSHRKTCSRKSIRRWHRSTRHSRLSTRSR